MSQALANRLCGSPDLYQRGGERPINSINYVTCHDGFTLNDLVSYPTKDNWANGEGNRDGSDQNFSVNYGVEGPSTWGPIETLRLRQIKNLLATLMLSRGVPMLLGGDEFRRSQNGNNNAYCQDNETSWYDWPLMEENAELVRFVRELIAFRARHPVLRADGFYSEQDVSWYGQDGDPARWRPEDQSLACLIGPTLGDCALLMACNASVEEAVLLLPRAADGREWRTAISTAAPSPQDVFSPGAEPPFDEHTICLPRALAVLIACGD